MAVSDPANILNQFFPAELLNFDVAPPGTEIGPLHAIFTVGGQVVAQFTHDQLLLQANVAISGATGLYLDLHGIAYSVVRLPGETDAPYRVRILAALTSGRCTGPAIASAVIAYYGSTLPLDDQPNVTVWDIQSQPALAAMFDIVRCQFVVDISYELSPALVFWAGYSYAGRTTYAWDGSGYSNIGPIANDPNLMAVVQAYKAAAYQPIYRIYSIFGTSARAAMQYGAGASIVAHHVKDFAAGARVINATGMGFQAGAYIAGSPVLPFGAGAIIKTSDYVEFAAGAKILALTDITTDDTTGPYAGDDITTDDTSGPYAGLLIATDS